MNRIKRVLAFLWSLIASHDPAQWFMLTVIISAALVAPIMVASGVSNASDDFLTSTLAAITAAILAFLVAMGIVCVLVSAQALYEQWVKWSQANPPRTSEDQ